MATGQAVVDPRKYQRDKNWNIIPPTPTQQLQGPTQPSTGGFNPYLAASQRIQSPNMGIVAQTLRQPQYSGAMQPQTAPAAPPPTAPTGPTAPGGYGITPGYSPRPETYPYQAGTEKPFSPQQERQAQYQAAALGPGLSSAIMPTSGPLTERDIAFNEARLGYETQLKQEQAQQRAYEEMARGYGNIGTLPEEVWTKGEARGMYEAGGPYTQTLMDQLRSELQDRAAMGNQASLRQAAEGFARRGLGGSLSEYEQAALQQQNAAALQGQLADLSQTAATTNWGARQQALQDYSGMLSGESQRRQTLDEAIANLFATQEYEAPSLASLTSAAQPKKGKQKKRAAGF